MTLSLPPRPPHRLERLRAWMEAESVDCTVVFGTDNVNHLCGYWRYYGGPSALVIDRDGERTLVVMRDEVPIARALSDADEVIGYAERGFGINLDLVTDLIAAVAAVPAVAGARRIGVSSELPGVGGSARPAAARVRRPSRPTRRRALPDQAAQGLGRAREDPRVVRALLARPGRRRTRHRPGRHRDRAVHGGPVDRAARVGRADRVPVRPVVGAELGGRVLPDPRRGQAGRRGRRPRDRRRGHSHERLLGRLGRDARLPGRTPTRRAHGRSCSTFSSKARTELVPGATGAEVFANIHAGVVTAFPDGELPHHGGHALGLTSFEDPHVIPSDTTPFEPWMVLAIEPGVYFPGGLRRSGREHLRRHACGRHRAP